MGRVARGLVTAVTMLVAATSSASAADAPIVVHAAVDADDDDGNGVPDGQQARDVPSPDLVRLPGSIAGALRLRSTSPPGAVRVLVDGAPVATGSRVTAERVRLQALAPGRHQVDFGRVRVEVRAVQIVAIDGELRRVDLTRSHASFQRTPPDRIDRVGQKTGDPDALRYVLVGHPQDVPNHVRIESRTELGQPVDLLRKAKLVQVPCPRGFDAAMTCRSTWPIRLVADAIDQGHPLVVDRSIRGTL
ncbi:MAG: hypothetical protein ACOC1F_02410, partial [Myxococcota bacterium]